jgi:hypothetical protein
MHLADRLLITRPLGGVPRGQKRRLPGPQGAPNAERQPRWTSLRRAEHGFRIRFHKLVRDGHLVVGGLLVLVAAAEKVFGWIGG